MESVLEGMAEHCNANLGENVARGLNGNALRCHPNSVPVYGWDIAGARIDDGMPAIVSDAEWALARTPRAAKRRKPARHRKHVFVRPGMTFGDLEAVELSRVTKNRNYVWLCRCRARGGMKAAWAQRLTSGKTTHCGCKSVGQPRGSDGKFVSRRA